MPNLSKKQQKILYILLKKDKISSSNIQLELAKSEEKASLVTVKRLLTQLAKADFLQVSGSGRSTVYSITALGRAFIDIDAKNYCFIEPDKRFGQRRFNFDFFPIIEGEIFNKEEKNKLEQATNFYKKASQGISATIEKKELERLVIELSWKSSKIEGNTYTLLDTEKLILENKAAAGKSREETQMILNHKEAFHFVYQYSEKFKSFNRKNLEDLHAILIKNLNVEKGLRQKPVGVVGSIYQPLDNLHQIVEAIEQLTKATDRLGSPYAKAFLALLGIAYIQPFADGNKRSSRLMANALLLAYGRAPLSYRSIDEEEYREALLVFYELNSLIPLKKIFIEQYDFAARNYLLK